MYQFIPYARQSLDEEDVRGVVDALRSDWLTQGPGVDHFESAAAHYFGVKHAVAVSSATAGLHLACQALGLGPNGRLWTSPNTFVASANCARYCGAEVDFVDICPKSYNLSTARLAEKLEQARRQDRLPDIVVPVHFAGQSCAMRELRELSRQYGFRLVEDAAHAAGATYLGRKVGGCEFSDMAVLSFHAVKVFTTGEGGMVLTNEDDTAARVRLLRSHGITREEALMQGTSEGPWYYQQIALGEHYRITDFQCALGTSQLKKLDAFVTRRREIAAHYNRLLARLPLVLPWQDPATESPWHLYVVQLDTRRTGQTRLEVFNALRQAGIGVNVHYIPVPSQPYYRKLGFSADDYPEAQRYYRHALSLPMYSSLSDSQVERVASVLSDILA